MPVYPGTVKKALPAVSLPLILILCTTIFCFFSSPVSADDGPDLIVHEITLSPAEPAIDDTVTITVSVKNQGTSLATQSYVVCYVDSTILATKTINQLDAGTMATTSFTWVAEPGSHNIRAIADSSEAVDETDETNNSKTYALTTRAADLIIQSITWSPANPSRGDTIVFSMVIKNQGNARSRITEMDLFIDGSTRGTQNIAAIDPSGTYTVTYNWVALTGQHNIRAVVDIWNKVKEGDETNNENTITFFTEAPDLIIENIVWSPQNPSKNDDVSINATVRNQGSGRADANHMAYYIDSELISTLPVGALEANESVNITFSWKAAEGEHSIKTVIDHYQNVVESDETNNEKTAFFSTVAPDLVVSGITWEPLDAVVGDNVTFTATIRNQGGGRSAATKVACHIDGSTSGTKDIPEIEATEETTVTFLWVAVGGSHTVSITADYGNMIDETVDDNNKLTATISVILPDLCIPSISWAPANFAIDDIVTFSVNVTNLGGGRTDNFYIAYYIDDTLEKSEPIIRLDSGASVNKTWTWKALNGRHNFKAVVNYNKYLIEDNYSNNEYLVTVAPNMPDLTVDTVTWSPADIVAGSNVQFDIVIKNLGTLNAGPSRIAYYVDGAVAGFNDIGQLNADAVMTVHFTWNAMAGLHTINIVADSADKILEIDEVNNTKVVSLPPPDLIVQSITWSPAGASTGDMVTLTANIKNLGDSRSQSTQVEWYIDGLLLGKKDLPEIDPSSSETSTFDWTAVAGQHKIKLIVDTNNYVIESDETNNSLETNFATMTPDMVIEDISWIMESPLTDDKVDFTITVKNQGTGKAGVFQMKYDIDQLHGMTEEIIMLPAGDIKVFTFSRILTAGPHSIDVFLDQEDQVAELNESNNNKTLDFSTLVPDLIVKSIALSPAVAVPGDNITITVKAENRGKDKCVNSKLSLVINGSIAGDIDIPEINTGEIITKDFNWKAVAGNYEIIAYMDIGNLIIESNETNNSKSRTLTIDTAVEPDPKPVKLSSSSTTGKGFVANWWWLLLLAAAVLAGGAFVSTLRSFRKG